MIITLALWLIVFTAAAGYGRLVTPRGSDSESVESKTTRIYAGLLIVSAILLAIALFTNLTPWLGLIAALPGVAIYGKERTWSKPFRDYYLIYALIALFISVREINFYDTALYHQQSVKWLAEHGLVRGLALVYFRFGLVSSWFALAAPLDHGVTAGRVGIIGGLPFALAIVSSFQILRGFVSRNSALICSSTSWVILSLMLSLIAVVWNVDNSLSPDMMVWLLPLIIVSVLMDSNKREGNRIGQATIISAMACLIKPTAIPVFAYCSVLLAWRFVRTPQDRGKLAGFVALALGISTLLFATNLITSGCPLFPSPFGCTSLEWSVGAGAARSIQALVQEFARTSRHSQIFPLTAAAALASAVLVAVKRTDYSRHVLGISWMGIAFVLIVAPVPRYGLGYFLFPVAAAIAGILERNVALRSWSTREYRGWVNTSAVLTAIAAIVVPIFSSQTRDAGWLLYPRQIAALNGDPIHIVNRVVDVRRALTIHAERRGELTVWVPASSDQCWDAPLPCTPALTRGDLKLRNKGNLDTGFLTP